MLGGLFGAVLGAGRGGVLGAGCGVIGGAVLGFGAEGSAVIGRLAGVGAGLGVLR
ncbi:hypothetical protein Asi02nite_74020 [Asanoa siamensis]|uniref:Uncharacterized protein n=1 Tax=Asanoa siamensis TaxID=926357 RepID=A0ABQ4D2W8_9ACTN|nr:hypothetical protein Asi02nite_74020 [Asanoa siamensis]